MQASQASSPLSRHVYSTYQRLCDSEDQANHSLSDWNCH